MNNQNDSSIEGNRSRGGRLLSAVDTSSLVITMEDTSRRQGPPQRGQSNEQQPTTARNTEDESVAQTNGESLRIVANIFELLIFGFVFSFVSTLSSVSLSGHFVYVPSLCILIATHVVSIRRTLNNPFTGITEANERKWRKSMDILEHSSLLFLEVFAVIWFEFLHVQVLIIAIVPYAVFFFLHCLRYDEAAQDSILFLTNCFRTLFLLQTSLILLKADHLLRLDWPVILFPTWIVDIVIVFYTLGIFVIIGFVVYYHITGDGDRNQGTSNILISDLSKVLGLFYLFLNFSGLSATCLCLPVGLLHYFKDGSMLLIRIGLLSLTVFTAASALFLHWQKRGILLFIYRLVVDVPPSELSSPQLTVNTERRGVEQKKVRRVQQFQSAIPLFVQKISTSYFKAIRSEAEAKKLLSSTKDTGKGAVKGQKKRTLALQIDTDEANGTTQEMKRAVASTKHGGEKITPSDKPWPGTTKHPRDLKGMIQTRGIPELSERRKQSIILNSPKASRITTPKSNADEKLCCVCYCAEPDAVFLECGHGGLCFECALGIWEKGDECYLCRSPIEQVIQLDLEVLHSARLVKVKACTRMEGNSEPRGYYPDSVETH